jgi:hypothetical protein
MKLIDVFGGRKTGSMLLEDYRNYLKAMPHAFVGGDGVDTETAISRLFEFSVIGDADKNPPIFAHNVKNHPIAFARNVVIHPVFRVAFGF